MVFCSVCKKQYKVKVSQKIWICFSCNRGQWSTDDILKLKVMREGGMWFKTIAEELGKPELAVKRKARYLRIKPVQKAQHTTVECTICGKPVILCQKYAKSLDEYICRSCKSGGDGIGETRTTKYGFIQIKMPTHPWQMKHIVMWIINNGDIPPGYYIAFKDNNKSNISIDNLELRILTNNKGE